MAKFKIPIEWSSHAEIEVEAESLDEAVDMIELNSDEVVLPEDWDVVEGSIDVNFEVVKELNPGHELKEGTNVIEDPDDEEKELPKVEEVCDDEEREARRHLEGLGEGYGEETEEEIDEDEN